MDRKEINGMPEYKTLADCSQCGWLGLCTVGCPYPHPELIVNPTCSTASALEAELDEVEFEVVEEATGETDRTC